MALDAANGISFRLAQQETGGAGMFVSVDLRVEPGRRERRAAP
jgi:hypothetical protein